MKLKLAISCFCLMVCVASFAQKAPEPFVNGDRIVFAGNSITEHGFYETYIWLYYITHFPERKITVFNGGIGGDVARQVYIRLDSDLLAKKPTVMTIDFGMNDSRYFEYTWHKDKIDSVRKSAIDTSYYWFEKMRDKLNAHPEIKKIMLASSPYDETMKNGKDFFPGKFKTMEGIIAFQKEAAIKNNWAYVDFFYPMTELDKQGQQKDTSFTLTGDDRIHPGNAGHTVMAYLFLKAQGLANKPVADVVIDAKSNKALKTDNATVSSINKKGDAVSFKYFAKSLPFPIDSTSRIWGTRQKQYEALSVVPFMKEFDNEMLSVKSLDASANYVLKIDGNIIGNFTGTQLNDGINLAMYGNTPQYQQAKKVAALQLQHKEIEDKIRAYYWVNYDYLYDKGWFLQDSQAMTDSVMNEAKKNPFINGKKEAYAETNSKSKREVMQQKMLELEKEMYEAAQPVAHTITITKVD